MSGLRRVVAGLSLVLAAPVAAADEAEPAPAAPTLGAVTVEADEYEPRRDDVASRVVVSSKELARFGDTRLTDALARLPGVTVGRGGGLALRGMGQYTQVLVDGEAMPPGFSLDALSPGDVERVEIKRVATADQRTAAIAGTINIVLRKAGGKPSRRLQLTLGGEADHLRPGATWTFSSRDGEVSRSLALSARQSAFESRQAITETALGPGGERLYLREGRSQVVGGRDALVATPRWTRRLANGELRIDGLFDASRFHKDGRLDWETREGAAAAIPSHASRTELELIQLRARLAWEHATEGGGRWNTSLSWYGNREDNQLFEQAPATPGRPAIDQRTGTQLSVATFASTGKYSFPAPEGHAPEWGWDLGEDHRDEHRSLRGAGLDLADSDYHARVRRLALYAQDEWAVGGPWSLYLGARWERLATRAEGSGLPATEQQVDVVSPILQALRKPGKRSQLRFALSRTYKAPALRLLIPRPHLSLDNSQLDPDLRGNPLLRPELALGVDANWAYFRGDDVTMSVGAWVRRIEDVVRSETVLEGDRWVSSPVNGGDARSWGLETEARFALAGLVEGAPDLALTFSLARNWSRLSGIEGPGNRLDDQPALSGKLGMDYSGGEGFSMGASWRYERYDYARTNALQAYLASTTRSLDLYAAWRLPTGSRLRIGVGNALGDDARWGSQYRSPEGAQDVLRRRRVPTTLNLGLTHEF